jgi:hypothetical protein
MKRAVIAAGVAGALALANLGGAAQAHECEPDGPVTGLTHGLHPEEPAIVDHVFGEAECFVHETTGL